LFLFEQIVEFSKQFNKIFAVLLHRRVFAETFQAFLGFTSHETGNVQQYVTVDVKVIRRGWLHVALSGDPFIEFPTIRTLLVKQPVDFPDKFKEFPRVLLSRGPLAECLSTLARCFLHNASWLRLAQNFSLWIS
jgi:hypothetical protein